MQFLKILFWCLLAFVAALFTYGNWNTVPIHLWSQLIADVNLPLLLLVTFLSGLLPAISFGNWQRWRLRQRLAASEQALAHALAPPPPPPSPAIPEPDDVVPDVPPEPA